MKKILVIVLISLSAIYSAPASSTLWVGTNGVSATANWSDALNWTTTPANNAANFTGSTTVNTLGPITVNVDGAYGTPGTGLAQTYGAFFGQINGYQTVFIQPGITWAIQTTSDTQGIGMEVGPQPTNNTNINIFDTVSTGLTYTNYTTITGSGGTLFANTGGLRVEGASTVANNHYSILDMSGLGTFIMTNNGGLGNSCSFYLVDGGQNSQGLIYLASTNMITLNNSFQVGYLGTSKNSLPIGIYLGRSNYISTGANSNVMVIGSTGCTNAFMRFNPALVGAIMPTAYITGTSANQNAFICSTVGGAQAPGYAICDFTGGNVTWIGNSLKLGVSGTPANGVLTFDNGTIAFDTILIGSQTVSAGAPGVGTINIGTNATLQASASITLGATTGTVTAGTAGTININTNGTLAANTIVNGGAGSTINMTNANWNVSLTSTGVTNIRVANFHAGGTINMINITSIAGNTLPLRFHLISTTASANLVGASTLRFTVPASFVPNYPYAGHLDYTTTPGMVDFVLTAAPFPFVRTGDLLTNPGFEVDPPGPTTTIYGWNPYSSVGGNVVSETASTLGNDGNNYLQLSSANIGVTNYNGIYQDNISGPGAVYSADGWACTTASSPLFGQNVAGIQVTFRDVNANILALYRSALINTNAIVTGAFPKNTWIDLPVTNQYDPATLVITNYTSALVAPPGTAFVRVEAYFQGDAANSPGSVYFDDLTLLQTGGGPYGNWNIVWSDEFNGTSLSTNWTCEIGGGGWGNNELEYYTSSPSNVYVSNGLLNIVGLLQSYGGENYTSARITTLGIFHFLYGRIAFRVKVPPGAGLWPAMWLVPEDSVYGPWAASGEIDVMESTGQLPNNVIGTIHYGGPSPDTAASGGPSYNYIPGASLYNFNVYVLDWSTNAISWYINGWLYETQTNWWSSSNTNNTELNPYPAPFNEPFAIIMNLAIGGSYGGAVDNSVFPADLQIDYVRLYNLTAPLQLTASRSGEKLTLTWPTNIVCHLESTTNLSLTSDWTNVTGAVTPYSVTPRSAAFYRLASP